MHELTEEEIWAARVAACKAGLLAQARLELLREDAAEEACATRYRPLSKAGRTFHAFGEFLGGIIALIVVATVLHALSSGIDRMPSQF